MFNLKLHHCNTLLTLNNESETTMRTKRYYEIVEIATGNPIPKDETVVLGSAVNRHAANVRCAWANSDAGYKKYKVIRGELINPSYVRSNEVAA